MVLAVVALVVLCLGVIVLFNTGQSVTKKVELVNAADAAAYSAAVQQARTYNLIAYMNRAAVANEVAVAQMVSWYSWTNFALRGTDNLKDALQVVAAVFDVTVVLAEVGAALQEVVTVLNEVKSVVKTIRDTMQQGFSAGVSAVAALNTAYSRASQMLALVDKADTFVVVDEVVKRNTDGKAHVGARGYVLLGESLLQARAYEKRYTIPSSGKSPDGDRYANVVMEARDGFSRKRNGSFDLDLSPLALFELHKRGGADLIDYKNWVSADTLDLNAEVGCIPLAGCLFDEDVPLAWGGGAVVDQGHKKSFKSLAKPGFNNGDGWDSDYDIDRGHYDPYSGGIDNGAAGKKVLSSPAIGGQDKAWLTNYLSPAAHVGLQDYNDVDAGLATVPYLNGKSAAANGVKALDAGPVFTVLVEQPMNTVRTSSNIDGLGGPPDFEAPDEAVGDNMTALSSAQVYFERSRTLFPSFIDARREMGNLFSPYWQARLVDTPCSVRQQVAVSFGTVNPSCL